MYLKEATDTLSFNFVKEVERYRWYCTWEFGGEKFGINTAFKDITKTKLHLDSVFEAYTDIYAIQLKRLN